MPAITDGSDDETKALHIALRYAIHYSGELRDKSNAALLKAANAILTKLEAGIAPKTEREMLMAARNSFAATVNEMHAAAHGVPIGPNGEIEGAVDPVLGLVEDVEALYARASRAEKERDEALKAARIAATHAADAVAFAERMEKERVDYSECRADNTKLRAQFVALLTAIEGVLRTEDGVTGIAGWRIAAIARNAGDAGRGILDALTAAVGALSPFKDLGRPHPPLLAFHDLDHAVIIYANSGVYITAGDVRALQAALGAIKALGLTP